MYPLLGSKEFLMGIKNVIEMVNNSKMTILIVGETGTGKTYIGKHISANTNKYSGKPTVLSVAGLPENLIESELFGYAKGSFTGAVNEYEGKILAADKRTVILDDISCLPIHLQVKLLKLLDGDEFDRIGDTTTYNADVRFIVTSNDDLPAMVRNKTFREDLYYRINSFVMKIPPLRSPQRKADIPVLARHFVKKYGQKTARGIIGIEDKALSAIKQFNWPGNVRELEREMECAVNRCVNNEKKIGIKHLSEKVTNTEHGPLGRSVAVEMDEDSFKRKRIIDAMRLHGGKKEQAAKHLGKTRRTLYNWLKKYNIKDSDIF